MALGGRTILRRMDPFQPDLAFRTRGMVKVLETYDASLAQSACVALDAAGISYATDFAAGHPTLRPMSILVPSEPDAHRARKVLASLQASSGVAADTVPRWYRVVVIPLLVALIVLALVMFVLRACAGGSV